MFATFMAAMQAKNTKLALTLESKLNTIKFRLLTSNYMNIFLPGVTLYLLLV
jgi:hypothetical protein